MILLILLCLALTATILIQTPKGNVVAMTQFVSAGKAKEMLTKITWGLGVSVVLFTLILM